MTKKSKSQLEYIKDFFKSNPLIEHKTTDIKKIIENKYLKETNKRLEDCDRGIRTLHAKGWLIKIGFGVHKYDPNYAAADKTKHDFSPSVKKQILIRDKYQCVLCKRGKKHGEILHVDHIKPRDKDGKSTLENGQTLCSRCNFLKKNLSVESMGKKIFENLYKQAKKENNIQMKKIATEFLKLFQKYNLN